MTAQRGKDLLLTLDDGTGNFVTVAGIRTRRLALNAQTIDATDADSIGQWRELLAGGGVRRSSLTGGGLFKDQISDALIRQAFFNGTVENWQIIIPGFGTIQGLYQISALDYRGDYNAELTFEITLESAGALTFTAC